MKRVFCLFFCVLFLCLGGCVAQNETPSLPNVPQADDTASEYTLTLDGRRFTFEGDSDRIEAVEDRLTILQGGTYRIRGTLTEGSLQVCVPPDAVVRLILDGISITSSYHSPLVLKEAACVILEVEKGSVNRLTDTKRGAVSTSLPEGCLTATCDLILRGEGALYLSGRQDTALVCGKDLTLSGTALSLSAPEAGVWVGNRLRMTSGSLTVSAAKRGVVTDQGGAREGLLSFEGGRLVISCSETALKSSGEIRITGTEASLLAPTKYDAPKIVAP